MVVRAVTVAFLLYLPSPRLPSSQQQLCILHLRRFRVIVSRRSCIFFKLVLFVTHHSTPFLFSCHLKKPHRFLFLPLVQFSVSPLPTPLFFSRLRSSVKVDEGDDELRRNFEVRGRYGVPLVLGRWRACSGRERRVGRGKQVRFYSYVGWGTILKAP